METSIEQLCAGTPTCFAKFLHYCRSLEFAQEPDYGFLRGLFQQELPDVDLDDYSHFDWFIPVC